MRLARPEILSAQELDTLYLTALELLQKVGVQIQHDETVELLKKNGCEVGPHRIVYFPENLVKECLRSVPRQVTLCGRDSKYDMEIGTGRNTYTGPQFPSFILDHPSNTYRWMTLKDLEIAVRISDYLNNIDWVMSFPAGPGIGYGVWDAYVNYEVAVSNTTKHVCISGHQTANSVDPTLKLAAAVVGGEEELRKRPITSVVSCCISPLIWGKDNCEVLEAAAKWGIPTYIDTEGMMGAVSPVTIAGNLAQKIAEFLSGCIILQVRNKGMPVMFVPIGEGFDMRTGQVSYGGAACFTMTCAFGQIGRYLNVPTCAVILSDSHLGDMQMAYENSYGFLSAMLAGVDQIVGVVQFEQSRGSMIEALPLLDEMSAAAHRILEGIEVTPETLAVDVIKNVCERIEEPGGLRSGFFITDRHTTRWYEREQRPRRDWAMERNKREKWVKLGSKTYLDRAKELNEQILKRHQVTPLPESVREKMIEIREAYGIRREPK
jgi:trimethylamine--corrinoid protein Co-methyltransferase